MNRLLKLLDRRAIRWTGRILSVAVFVYAWFGLVTSYDLNQLDDTPGFRYGFILAATCFYGVLLIATYLERRPVKQPLPVDPHFPPTKLVYLQGDGAPERCACHGKPIEDGAEILHWPQPAKLICVEKDHAE
jgi:hypothetical protein